MAVPDTRTASVSSTSPTGLVASRREVGQPVAIQLQGLARDGDTWIPERRQIANELLVECEAMDVTPPALRKLRLPEKVIPVP